MKKPFLLLLLCAWLPSLAHAVSFPKSDPPDCDTLITKNGKTLLVVVGWQGNQEIQYQLCNDESGRVYAIQRDSIRELKRQKNPVVVPPKIYTPPKDTADLLTLTDGKTYRVVILVRDYLNTYYRLYDDPLDDREYCVPNQRVRSLRYGKRQIKQKGNGSCLGTGCLIALIIVGGIPLLLLFVALL